MKVLAIDTATENCSAALLIDGSLQSREIEMERGHAERILPMVDELLAQAGLTLRDLDAIAFGRGPGSFTGVRLAVTVTQGLAFGANLGVVPISDLRAVAQRAFRADATLTRALVCNDARMSEVYWACFERGGDGLARLEGEEQVSKPTDVKLPPTWSTATAAGRGFAHAGSRAPILGHAGRLGHFDHGGLRRLRGGKLRGHSYDRPHGRTRGSRQRAARRKGRP